ncbi:MAG TPA: hypothetical protein VEL76_36555 [Gemmataceae bacterium]|nr:hypothetical protein [Gemmataceae bacterium]
MPAKRPTAQRPRLEVLEDRTALSNVHLVGEPTITFNASTDTLTVAGKLAGLGNKDFNIAVTVAGEVNFDVRNPAGHEAPGITKKVNGFTDVTISKSAIQNGTYNFSISVPIVGGTVALPNPQWTATFVSASFDVTLVVTQGRDTINLGTFDVTIS